MENEVDGTGVVFHEEPVAHVLALTIYGQRFAVAYVVDKEWDKFLGELIRTVVVRAVGHDGGQSVGVVVRTHEVVARSLRGGVGRVGRVFRALQKEVLSVGVVMLCR